MVMRSDTAATAPLQGARAGWSDRARYMATIARGHTWHGAVPEGAKPVVRVADASGGIPAEIVSMWANAAKAPVPQPVAPAERSRGGYLDKLTASGAIDPDAPVNVAPDWQGLTRDVNGVVASMLPVAQAARFFGADEYAGYLDESRAGLNPLVARAVEYAGHLGGSGASHMPQVPAVARTVPKLPERAATAAIDAWMPQNAVGIFGGRLAKTADLTKLAKAEEMASKGIPREQIWNDTGWFKGVDGKWRFEIDDSTLKRMIPPADWIGRRNGVAMAPSFGTAYEKAAAQLTPHAPVRMKRIFEHEALDLAYPDGFTTSPQHNGITSIPVALIQEGTSVHGQYMPDGYRGMPMVGMNEALLPGQARETALHEWQHAVAEREGFPAGSGTDRAREAIRSYNNSEVDKLSTAIREMETTHPVEFGWFRKKNAATAMKDWDAANAADAELLKTEAGRNLDMMDWRRASIAKSEPTHEQIADHYRRDAGEVEARTVQRRANLNAEGRRAHPPFVEGPYGYDVPEHEQIVGLSAIGPQEARPVSTTPEQRAQILKLRSEGKSNSEIARHVGTSAPTVSRVANAKGDVRGPTPRPRVLTPQQEAQLSAERAAGIPDKQLAHKYGVHQTSVGIIDRRHQAEAAPKKAAE